MRLAIIGDIHGNAPALAAALAKTDRAGYDLRVFTGDLLTYGVKVQETLDLVSDAVAQPRNILLRGNHDLIYDRALTGDRPTDNNWVHRHMLWTLPRIPTHTWRALPFRDEFRIDDLLVTHANPFGLHDWRYLNSIEDHRLAATALRDQNLRCGVFGHTHRARVFFAAPSGGRFLETGPDWRAILQIAVVNAGSIGQPRSSEPRELILWVETREPDLAIRFEPLDYDEATHLHAISASDLPADIKARCLAYHPQA